MWTPKRLLLSLAGFTLFFTAYLLYARFFGGIDGLTPLPDTYRRDEKAASAPLPDTAPRENVAVRKLRQAFGAGSPELERPVQLDMPEKGLVLAIDDGIVMPEPQNHRVKLVPFSLAIFRGNGKDGFPEINTIRADEAYLELDRPIKNLIEIGNRRIIGAELQGEIQLINNRRTETVTDDLSLFTKGPVFYEEKRALIWTPKDVKIIDLQNEPEPTTITATGMYIYLTQGSPSPAKNPAGNQTLKGGERISDVEKIELSSNVRMDLWDSQSGFLSAGKPAPKAVTDPGFVGPPNPPPSKPKSKVVITTNGKFVFNLKTNLATFDIPHGFSRHPEIVRVVRENENDQGKRDQLECDHLELQFHRKAVSDPKASAGEKAASREIESAHATGKDLTLTSDTEALTAFGNDLFHDAAKKISVLKGTPKMVALKDGNEIQARELWMGGAGQKEGQQAVAIGPGEISMLQRTADGKMARTLKARWQDKLVHIKEGAFDCLTLTGNAAFDDPQNGQKIRAELLRVWLEPSGPKVEGEEKHPRPHHVEAKGRVTADSPEIHIKEPTENLVIWFKDIPVKADASPITENGELRIAGKGSKNDIPVIGTAPFEARASTAAVAQASPGGKERVQLSDKQKSLGADASAATYSAPTPSGTPAGPEKPKKPIDLSAHAVEVYVLRNGQKNDLERLWCEGTVHVHQDPETPEDKGVDIRGDSLQLDYAPEGGVLLVFGNSRNLASVQFNKMSILGPEVTIDQRSNKAEVHGFGSMRMLSETNFEGAKLAQPTVLIVQWKDNMNFEGKFAEFYGNVQATQENSRLLCQRMTASFDRPISLKDGNKAGQNPKVDNLMCDQSVEIEEKVIQGEQLVSIRRLVSPYATMDNAKKLFYTSGPGEVRIFQLGSSDDFLNKPPPRGAVAKKEATQEYKITHVRYGGTLQGTTGEPRMATFFDNVEVVHVPATRPDMIIDIDKMPEGGMYMHCEKLTVWTHRLANGRNSQEMRAEHKVRVQTKEYYGNSDVVTYDEAQDKVIFKGGKGNPAVLYQYIGPGVPPNRISGEKIFYWRNSNKFEVENSTGLITN